MGARRNFSLWAKATRPFPISPFPFLSFSFPPLRCTYFHAKRPLKYSIWGGLYCKLWRKSAGAPFPLLPLPLPSFFTFPSLPTPCLSLSFPLSLPLLFLSPPFSPSFLPVWARGSGGAVSKQRKLNYSKLHFQSTNRKWFSPVAGDNIIRDYVM